jgi:tetratricopeptide (TPR) repeat protein
MQKPTPQVYNDSAVSITKNYTDTTQFSKAIELLNRAIELDSNYFKSFINRLFFEESLGHFDKATVTLGRMIRLRPDSAELYLKNGTYYEISGDTVSAFANYNRALPRYTIMLDTMSKNHPMRLYTLKMLAINIILLGQEKMLNDMMGEDGTTNLDSNPVLRDILGKNKQQLLDPLRKQYKH